jgi:hypothetical protein
MHAHVCTEWRTRSFGGGWEAGPVTTEAEAQSPGTRGEAMVAELKWVHSMIRRDLRIVRELADGVQEGRPAAEVAGELRTLAAAGPMWQLKINCLQYCRVVHSHHHLESVLLFPALRRTNPAIGPVVDKLEADHAGL